MIRKIKNAKPCPFCGNKFIRYCEGEGGWVVHCGYDGKDGEYCGASIGGGSKQVALKGWNERVKQKQPAP